MRLELLQDSLEVQDAVARRLEIIGEAASAISEETKSANPEIEWNKVIGLRNMLLHDYYDIDIDDMYHTSTEYVPQLKSQIEALLATV
jgi:uncharacterized protein with HEPN domain